MCCKFNPTPNNNFFTLPNQSLQTISNLMKINCRKFDKCVDNTVGKVEKCWLQAISPFPTVFSKDLFCSHVKSRACLGKGQVFTLQSQVSTSNFSFSHSVF